MGWMILIGVLFLIVVRISIEWLSEYLTYSTSKKEEREDAYISRTHAPKLRTTSSFAISCILIVAFIVGTIIIMLTEKMELSFWFGWFFGCLFIIALPVLLFLFCVFEYEVITQQGIKIYRMFRKNRFIAYNQMARYTYSFNQLIVYDKDGKVLFEVADMRVGKRALINALDGHGVYNGQ